MVTPDLGGCAIPTRWESIMVKKKKKKKQKKEEEKRKREREKKGAGRFVTSRKGIRRDGGK